jgi:hypothetical protein
MLYFGFQKLEIVCQTKIAFELGYLKKDAFENIWEYSEKCVILFLQSNSWRPLGWKELLCKDIYL